MRPYITLSMNTGIVFAVALGLNVSWQDLRNGMFSYLKLGTVCFLRWRVNVGLRKIGMYYE